MGEFSGCVEPFGLAAGRLTGCDGFRVVCRIQTLMCDGA
jgi:hypothetical protein